MANKIVDNASKSQHTITGAPPGSLPPSPTFDDQLQQLDFSNDAIDAALRKLLGKAQLPKEAQQIDRAMQDFAKRYCECNPDLMHDPDAIYAVAFSILLLHTDAHNKHVRHKMNKDTFIANTKLIDGGDDIPNEILDIMYDNIVSTEFTYAQSNDENEEDEEVKTSWIGRLVWNESTTSMVSSPTTLSSNASGDDLASRLAQLMPETNTYCYARRPINIKEVHLAFQNVRRLNLSGVRGRQQQQQCGNGNDQAMYNVRVVKAAVLERKYDLLPGGKRTSTRGWRPFGVALTGSQIVFFSDVATFTSWLEDYDTVYGEEHHHHTATAAAASRQFLPFLHPSISTSTLSTNAASFTSTFMTTTAAVASAAPTLRPVQIISLENAVCLYDEAYTKYPHVFRLLTGDGQQFLFKARDSDDLDDWMTKINYVATGKTKGVRLRPVVDTHVQNIKTTLASLSEHMRELQRSINKDLMLRRNLLVLEPIQRSTKERMVSYAEAVGRQLRQKWSVMQQLTCYHTFCSMALAHASSVRRFDRSATAPALSNGNSQQQQQQQQHQLPPPPPPAPQHLAPPGAESPINPVRRLSCPPFPFAFVEADSGSNHSKPAPVTRTTLDVPSSDRRNRSSSNPSTTFEVGDVMDPYAATIGPGRARSGSAGSVVSTYDEISILDNGHEQGSDTQC